jgi:hypothetical protein
MTIIRVPLPHRGAFNPERPLSDNLKAQVRQMKEIESKLAPRYQTDISIASIKTERQAGQYLRQMMAKLAPKERRARPQPSPLTALPRPSLRMLADLPLHDERSDRLGFKPFADALSGVIDSPNTATPLVMSINARWGAGKTSLGLLIKRRLETKLAMDGYSPHVTCWFDAWMHDDAPSLATSLAAEVASTANRHRPLWRRLLSPLPSPLLPARAKRVRKGSFYLALLLLAFTICVFIARRLGYGPSEIARLDPQVVRALISTVAGAYAVALVGASVLLFKAISTIFPVAKSVADFVRDPRVAAKAASMKDVNKQLGKLVKQATPAGSKFVIFIDDLDRCRPPRSVDVLEAINQLLDHTRVVVVIMADMQTIAKCVEIKYKGLAEQQEASLHRFSVTTEQGYGWLYTQKIVQLQFDLPIYPIEDIRHMLEALTKEVPKSQNEQQLSAWQRVWRELKLRIQRAQIKRAIAQRRTEIDNAIDTIVSKGESDLTQVETAIMNSNPNWKGDASAESLLRERLFRHLEDDSEVQNEAEDEVVRHLQPLPRHAKRLLNRLRLLLFVAHARKMFGGSPELGPRHLGKWAVLCERWPELAQSLTANSQAITALEGRAGRREYTDALSALAPGYLHDSALLEFMSSEIRLAGVVERIVRFQPA